MSYTEIELSEVLFKALNPEPADLPEKVIKDRELVASLRPVLENIQYLGSAKTRLVLEQEDQFKQIR